MAIVNFSTKHQNFVKPTKQQRSGWLISIKSICLSIFLFAITLLISPHQVRADAGRFLRGADYAELKSELASLQPPAAKEEQSLSAAEQQRLADLRLLERTIANADDRAQLTNKTTHNLGLFARYKKDPIDSAPQFFVLAPGHQSDDDYDFVALFVPQAVSLTWGDKGAEAAAANGPRLIRILEGQSLSVRDGADQLHLATAATVEPAKGGASIQKIKAQDGGSPNSEPEVTYKLSLPPFQVVTKWEPALALPALSQTALDQEIENAPLD